MHRHRVSDRGPYPRRSCHSVQGRHKQHCTCPSSHSPCCVYLPRCVVPCRVANPGPAVRATEGQSRILHPLFCPVKIRGAFHSHISLHFKYTPDLVKCKANSPNSRKYSVQSVTVVSVILPISPSGGAGRPGGAQGGRVEPGEWQVEPGEWRGRLRHDRYDYIQNAARPGEAAGRAAGGVGYSSSAGRSATHSAARVAQRASSPASHSAPAMSSHTSWIAWDGLSSGPSNTPRLAAKSRECAQFVE